MLGDKPPAKPKGKTCKRDRCRAWYRPNKYRSAGNKLEYCSARCLSKAQAEALVKQETSRDW